MHNTEKKQPFSITAPAKINLCLHVVGRRRDNYHLISSLVVFLDVFDIVSATESPVLKLNLKGPFAKHLRSGDNNSVIRAAKGLQKLSGITKGAEITLTKNLPISAGIGGGSADSAATIKLLLELWGVNIAEKRIMQLGQSLGADVPICLTAKPAFVSGIGEKIKIIQRFPKIWVLLVNPGKGVLTKKIFNDFGRQYSEYLLMRSAPFSIRGLIQFLKTSNNDLTLLATRYVPEIKKILKDIGATKGCLISRMSGSGATCFGIFSDKQNVIKAKKTLLQSNPNYWVACGQVVGNK